MRCGAEACGEDDRQDGAEHRPDRIAAGLRCRRSLVVERIGERCHRHMARLRWLMRRRHRRCSARRRRCADRGQRRHHHGDGGWCTEGRVGRGAGNQRRLGRRSRHERWRVAIDESDDGNGFDDRRTFDVGLGVNAVCGCLGITQVAGPRRLRRARTAASAERSATSSAVGAQAATPLGRGSGGGGSGARSATRSIVGAGSAVGSVRGCTCRSVTLHVSVDPAEYLNPSPPNVGRVSPAHCIALRLRSR